jgi:glycosyltransferase involved in cell wall biosynthesis
MSETYAVNILSWHRGWILDSLFREAAEAIKIAPRWNIQATGKKDLLIPKIFHGTYFPYRGDINVYTHLDSFVNEHKRIGTELDKHRNRVFITHLNEGHSISGDVIDALRGVERFLVQNSIMKSTLVDLGLDPNRIIETPGAVNRTVFRPLDSGTEPERPYVLFVGDFKYRKNPELVLQVIRSMPDINFVIHGKSLDQFPAGVVANTPNLNIVGFDFNNQPKLIREASTYVSLSRIEGGPISVLEALVSGTPVVATSTGFSSQYVNSNNGFVLPNPPTVPQVQEAIRAALTMKNRIQHSDLLFGKCTLQELGNQIYLS